MNMLQCHPHPGDFSDKSKSFHSCYFMGLQRKQGIAPSEGEQFDIRLTVEEFKHAVGMYTLWKPGMEIHVSHVKRKNIPNFVFPGGVRPARLTRNAGEGGRILNAKVPVQVEENSLPQELDGGRKRKRDNSNVETNLRDSKCIASAGVSGEPVYESQTSNGSASYSIKPGSTGAEMSWWEKAEDNADSASASYTHQPQVPSQNIGDLEMYLRCNPSLPAVSVSSGPKDDEKVEIEKITSGPYVRQQSVPAELDELEDDPEYKNRAKVSGQITRGSSMESSTTKGSLVLSLTTSKSVVSCSSLQSTGKVEELEVFSSNPVNLCMLHFCS